MLPEPRNSLSLKPSPEHAAPISAVQTVNGETAITISPTGAGYSPDSTDRIASYTVNFPTSGIYQLYAHLYVGPASYNDDSFFSAVSFGEKSPTAPSDWHMVNGLAAVGFTAANDVVSGSGTAGTEVWKWLSISAFAGPASLTVEEGNLQQTFQIAGREDGLYIDRLVFGTAGTAFTVAELESGIPENHTPTYSTNTFNGADGIAIHRFDEPREGINQDGANPASGLAVMQGGLFGITLNRGDNGCGAAFYLAPDGSSFTNLFPMTSGAPGGYALGDPLVEGSRFYTTATAGGLYGAGSILTGQPHGTITAIYDFEAVSQHTGINTGGANPAGQLILSNGRLFGCAQNGGANASGTLFSISTNGNAFTVLHNFERPDANTGTNSGGSVPHCGMVADAAMLHGTATAGGNGGTGVLFSINSDGSGYSVLHHFEALDCSAATNTGGAFPSGALVRSGSTIYGTTSAGGQHGCGTVYAIETDGTGFCVLHDFSGTDGARPFSRHNFFRKHTLRDHTGRWRSNIGNSLFHAQQRRGL